MPATFASSIIASVHGCSDGTRPRLAMYWASSCGGCEIALANLHEGLLELASVFDFFFCPCLLDTKRRDVEALEDGGLALTLFNGAIRTDENEDWARLLRRKSRLLVAFGACAYGGGIPALSNFHTREQHLEAVFGDGGSVVNPEGVVPGEPGADGRAPCLPRFHDRVRRLCDVVEVDYSVPGCPPEPHRIEEVLRRLAPGAPLPPRGTVLGAGNSTVCDECRRARDDKKIARFHRIWEIEPDRTRCLLEQGIACVGMATRDGCGAPCPEANMPCIGCYGPPEGVYDQGAKIVATLGSVLDIAPLRGITDEEEIARRVDARLDGLGDVAGVASKFHAVHGPAEHGRPR